MNQRIHYYIKSLGCLAFGIVLTALIIAGEVDHSNMIVCAIIIPVAFFAAWRFYKIAKATDPDVTVNEYAPPMDATATEQIAFYKKFIYLTLAAFPFMTWMVVSDLNSLQNGTETSVSLWAPVAFLYEHVGYWPAVASIPILGCICLTIFFVKIIQLRKGVVDQQKDLPG